MSLSVKVRRRYGISASVGYSKDSNFSADRSAGFTVLELMIATMVFSVILVIVTLGVISFTNRYYKGVNSSATQSSAQSIIDTISQSIQFGTGSVDLSGMTSSGNGHFCAGGNRFEYKEGDEYNGGSGFSVGADNGSCTGFSGIGTPRQLLGKNMRVTNLDVTKSDEGFYSIDVTVAFGDDDLLCKSSDGSCSSSVTMTNFNDIPDMTCKLSAGSQFCAVSRLKTSVEKRVGG